MSHPKFKAKSQTLSKPAPSSGWAALEVDPINPRRRALTPLPVARKLPLEEGWRAWNAAVLKQSGVSA